MKNYFIHNHSDRGNSQTQWLNSYHTFSFGNFYDSNRLGFRSLRVINEDWVISGAGFARHSHRDMEIISYVLEGALEHKDSLGNGSVIHPGDIQIMSAGTGIIHSEFNSSLTESVHFLQIWILPNQKSLQPRYEQRTFAPQKLNNQLCLVCSPDGRNDSVVIHQDVELYIANLEPKTEIFYPVKPNRYSWLQIAKGSVIFNGEVLNAGDGVQIFGEENLKMHTDTGSELLLFDLA